MAVPIPGGLGSSAFIGFGWPQKWGQLTKPSHYSAQVRDQRINRCQVIMLANSNILVKLFQDFSASFSFTVLVHCLTMLAEVEDTCWPRESSSELARVHSLQAFPAERDKL